MSYRNTEVMTISVAPRDARLIKRAAKSMKKSLSDFLRESAKQALTAYEWGQWCRKGEKSARKMRVSPEDVEGLIDDLRH